MWQVICGQGRLQKVLDLRNLLEICFLVCSNQIKFTLQLIHCENALSKDEEVQAKDKRILRAEKKKYMHRQIYR